MAHAATCSHRGTRYRTNQDAACVLAADTCRGELAMAIVCDGVGGLASGELASATVTERFCRWFEHRLPLFLQEDAYRDKDGLSGVEDEWRALLLRINADLVAYGKRHGCMLGTTFSGVFAAPGRPVKVVQMP